MLNKRVNILFNEDEWQRLSDLAKLKDNNASQLIRVAVRKTYFLGETKSMRKVAIDSIIKKHKIYKNINYKALINYGRKI